MNAPIVTVPFSKVKDFDISVVGAKGLNLGQLLDLRAPVPNGFAITSYAFNQHFTINGLPEFIQKELSFIDPADSMKIENAANRIRRGVLKFGLSKELEKTIEKAYSGLSGFTDSYVAVRSSAPIENIHGGSFSGQFATYLNVRGKDDLLEKVRYCWASLYTPKNIFYALSRGYSVAGLQMAVLVQKMVQAEVSGVLFTVNPIDNDPTKISIEAVLGLGEALADGQLTPDTYVIDKEKETVLEKHIVPQEWMLVRKGRTKRGEDPNVKVKVSEVWKSKQKLENKYIKKLIRIGKVMEDKFQKPQDVEWAYEGGKIWVVQSRPMTSLVASQEDKWKVTPTVEALRSKISGHEEAVETTRPGTVEKPPEQQEQQTDQLQQEESDLETQAVLLTGQGVHEGIVSAETLVVDSPENIKPSDTAQIVVAPNITREYLEKADHFVGLILNQSADDPQIRLAGKTLQVPIVAGTHIATKVVKSGEMITINGSSGEVVAGTTPDGLANAEKVDAREKIVAPAVSEINNEDVPDTMSADVSGQLKPLKRIKTATKLYTLADDADMAQSLAANEVDGAMIADSEAIFHKIGLHPQQALSNESAREDFIRKLSTIFYKMGRVFEPRNIIYKLNAMSSQKFADLQGGEQVESREENPLLGMRGGNRYLTLPEEVKLELSALKEVRNKENVRNISIAIPFVRTYKELREVKRIISTSGFRRSSSFKLYLVADVPSSVLRVEKLLTVGLDGVIMDADAMRQYLLAVDLANPRVQGDYKPHHPAVLWAIERIIKSCNSQKVESYVYGEIVTSSSKVIPKLTKWGISGIISAYQNLEEVQDAIVKSERSLITRRKR